MSSRSMTLQLHRKKSTTGIPLDDISVSLYESYLRSHWYHDQSGISTPASPQIGTPSPLRKKTVMGRGDRSFLPLYVYTALLRVVLLPWTEAPQTVADTFLDRLKSAEGLADVFSISPDESKVAIARALAANNQIASELQLQFDSISEGQFPGVSSSEDGLSTDAYSEWSKAALKEVQLLLQRHSRLPDFNGAVSISVVKAQQIYPSDKKGFRLRDSDLCPYVVVDLKDFSGNKVEKMITPVQPNTANPIWQTNFSPHPVLSEGCDLVMKVKHCTKGTEPLSGRDKSLLHTGIKLSTGDFHTGMPMKISIPLYGPSAAKSSASGGLCGCFGRGAQPLEADEGDAQPNTPGPAGKSGGVKIVYDPLLNVFEGSTPGWSEQGSLELTVVYYYESRGRDRRVENPLNDGRLEPGGRGSGVEDRSLAKSKSRGPQRGRSDTGGPSPPLKLSIEGLTYKQYLESILVDPIVIPPSATPASVSMVPYVDVNLATSSSDYGADVLPNAMFRALASSLHSAHRSGSLSHLEPFYSISPESSPRGQRSEQASPTCPSGHSASGIDPTVLASILAISPPKLVCDLIGDPRAKLPFGSGLTLLIKFAKLYRIRPETQCLVLLQYMLLHFDPVGLDTMVVFR